MTINLVRASGPVRRHQIPANPPFANMEGLKKFQDLGPDELIEYFSLGKQVYFTQPLQRMSAYTHGYQDRFWWEPSGGKNNALFSGLVTGIRMYSCGSRNGKDSTYTPDNHFPVLLVTYSIYKNPVPVMPWLTFETPKVYEYWRRQARKDQEKVELRKFLNA